MTGSTLHVLGFFSGVVHTNHKEISVALSELFCGTTGTVPLSGGMLELTWAFCTSFASWSVGMDLC